jgi:hypothetical protein
MGKSDRSPSMTLRPSKSSRLWPAHLHAPPWHICIIDLMSVGLLWVIKRCYGGRNASIIMNINEQ